jgi:uncharacterized protein YdeI (YjbR/CyaY-like superfamily)
MSAPARAVAGRKRPVARSPLFFENAAAFGAWLERHGATESELVVGFHKVGSGRPSMTWPESVDEALCHGWIDGVRTRIDEHAYKIRFSPRKKDSIWSAINIAKAEALVAQGRMHPAGLAAFERRTARKSSVYSYERDGLPALTAQELRLFRKNKGAWRYFEGTPPGYRRTLMHWIVSAKRPATRADRLARLIAASTAERRLFQ